MANALVEPAPTFSADDSTNHIGSNFKYITKLPLGIPTLRVQTTNFSYICLCKAGVVMSFAACRDQKFRIVRMLNVHTVGDVFEVFRSVIVLASIFVVNRAAFWPLTNKGEGHQMMDASGRLFSITRKGDDEITTRGDTRAKNGSLDPTPDLGYARQTTHTAQVAYLVNWCKKWLSDVRPNFFNHAISLWKNIDMPIISQLLMGSNQEVFYR